MMPNAVDIKDALAGLPMLRDRRPDTPAEEAGKAFATLATFETGGVFAGSFQGESAWERHRSGDELVQVLAGECRLTIITADGPTELEMSAGMLTIVPRGCWHKFRAETGVTVMTMTPQPTDHTTAKDPSSDPSV